MTITFKRIFKESALGRFFHRVAMSGHLFVPFHVVYFDVQHFQRLGILGEKCWKEVVSELNIFVGKWSKIAADFALQNMVETTLPD